MSVDKSIKHGKDHRKPYRGSKAFDRSCRPHGSCYWCRGNRLHRDAKARGAAYDELKDYNMLV